MPIIIMQRHCNGIGSWEEEDDIGRAYGTLVS